MKETINTEYRDWLIMYASHLTGLYSYNKLLGELYSQEFYWLEGFEMDSNRAYDGALLRVNFIDASNYWEMEDLRYLPENISLLEVIIALAARIEVDIMAEGNQTNPGRWIKYMLESSHLIEYDDKHYDSDAVKTICHNILERDYAPNGDGSLFKIADYEGDLRDAEIWYQANFMLAQLN